MTVKTIVPSFIALVLTFIVIAPVHAQIASAAAELIAPPGATEAGEPIVIPPPANEFWMTVSPPVLDLRTEPGASVSGVIKVKNNGSQDEVVVVELKKFKADATGAKPILMDLSPEDTFPRWIHFSESQLTLHPQAWTNVTYTFNPPQDASPAYFIAITFRRLKDIEISQNGQAAHGAAAVLCLVQVNSSRVYHHLELAQLDNKTIGFKTDHYIYEFLPVNFLVTMTNAGNVHEIGVGTVFIDWLTGNQSQVGAVDVNKERSAILPQTNRTFTSSWKDGFPVFTEQLDPSGTPVMDKNGQPLMQLKWDFSKLTSFRIGKFRAHLVMAYNDGLRDIPMEADAEFWVIPWRILAGLLVIIILIIIGLKGTIQGTWNKLKSARNNMKSHTPPPSTNNWN